MRLSLFGHSRLLFAAVLALASVSAAPAFAQGDTWALLKQPGHVVFMRHSDAPGSGGYGDPPGYRLDDCATQRNLSDEGRAHAKRTGEAFRKHELTFDRVLTSPWCRCKETAQLAIGKEAEIFAPLSNLVGRSEHRDEQVKALKAYLAGLQREYAGAVRHPRRRHQRAHRSEPGLGRDGDRQARPRRRAQGRRPAQGRLRRQTRDQCAPKSCRLGRRPMAEKRRPTTPRPSAPHSK